MLLCWLNDLLEVDTTCVTAMIVFLFGFCDVLVDIDVIVGLSFDLFVFESDILLLSGNEWQNGRVFVVC